MKRTLKTLPGNLIFLLLLLVVFITCERINTDLVENWKLTEASYLITANQNFTFYDPFSKPWQGTVTIDDEELEASFFNYYFDNSWPTNVFSFEDKVFTFFGSKLVLDIYDKRYILEPYEFDIASGIFKAEGVASGNDKSFHIKIKAAMPKIQINKGEQIVVNDAYYITPFKTLDLKNKGKLQTDYLLGDIMERLSGNWSVSNDKITLSPEKYNSNTYQYNLKGNTLYLFKENISGDEIPSNISPYADKISNITYQATYTTK